MRTLIQPELFHALKGPLVLAAGFFDGVHIGHRRVLCGAVARARELGGSAWALTFDRHPRSVIASAIAPALITQLPMRLEHIAASNIDGTFLLNFTPELAAQTPSDFVRSVCEGVNVAEIHCGENWRFGMCAAGTPDTLKELGCKYGFSVVVTDAALYDGKPVSSTRIRKAVTDGQLSSATAMLGRPYTIRETVVHGRRIARTYGFATANFTPAAELLPPVGVYAVESKIDGRVVRGLASLGFRPTFTDARPDKPILEVHFFDFSGDLYGATLDISFISFIREERKFASGEELFAQIKCDAVSVLNGTDWRSDSAKTANISISAKC